MAAELELAERFAALRRHAEFERWWNAAPPAGEESSGLSTVGALGLALALMAGTGSCVFAVFLGPAALLGLALAGAGAVVALLSTLRDRQAAAPAEPGLARVDRLAAEISGARDQGGGSRARPGSHTSHLADLVLEDGSRRTVELAPALIGAVTVGAIGVAHVRGGRLVAFLGPPGV